MQKRPRQPGKALWLATGAAVAMLGATAFSADAALPPPALPGPVQTNPQAIPGPRLAEDANPCSPCSPAEATKLCFDLNVGRPVPCTSMHKEEAEPDGKDFMTPHSGPRVDPE
ncbi:MAG: hypothetical protein J4G10_07370 [Alphaproteobacteria bacterium]|nr:hypothetical protein [Alphaproteobacteria bacterium]